MANESTINDQISDMVNFVNASNIGQSPSHSMGILDTVMAETIGMGMHNAITAQQNGQMIGNATVAATCSKILSVPIAIPPSTGEKITPLPSTMETKINKANEDATEAINKLRKLKTEFTTNENTITKDLSKIERSIKEMEDDQNSSSSSSSSSTSSSSSSSSP